MAGPEEHPPEKTRPKPKRKARAKKKPVLPKGRSEWPVRWLYLRQLFTPEEAKNLLGASEKAGYGDGSFVDGRYRGNVSTVFMSPKMMDEAACEWFYPRLIRAGQAAATVLEIEIDGMLGFVQFARYTSGDYYDTHIDHDPSGKVLPRDRKLSLFVSLVDGGKLGFGEDGSVATFAGDAIAFSALEPHNAPKQEEGVRFSCAAWFTGPRWT